MVCLFRCMCRWKRLVQHRLKVSIVQEVSSRSNTCAVRLSWPKVSLHRRDSVHSSQAILRLTLHRSVHCASRSTTSFDSSSTVIRAYTLTQQIVDIVAHTSTALSLVRDRIHISSVCLTLRN